MKNDDLISRAAVLRMLDENGVVFRVEIEKIPTIDAIPVEWLRGLKEKLYGNSNGLAYRMLLDVILNMWQKEQEAMA